MNILSALKSNFKVVEPIFERDILVSSITLIPESIVEKDYYVFMALKLMCSQNNEVMFKGGTSLSKAWGILNVGVCVLKEVIL